MMTHLEAVAFTGPGSPPTSVGAPSTVAVANAHPAVRAAAPELTSGHDVDGVAQYLEAVLRDG